MIDENDTNIAELREEAERNRVEGLKQEDRNREILKAKKAILWLLRDAKPSERSELARRYDVTITEFEKVIAYFKVYVVDQG